MEVRNQDLSSLARVHTLTISTEDKGTSLEDLNTSVSSPSFGEDELAFITAYLVHINNLDYEDINNG